MASLVNFTKLWKGININTCHPLPKNWRMTEHFLIHSVRLALLWYQVQIKKAQENYRPVSFMNTDAKILHPIPATQIQQCTGRCLPWTSEIYPRNASSSNITKSTNISRWQNKGKNYIIVISTDAKNRFEKFQHPLMIKPQQTRNGGESPQHCKGHLWKTYT